ncbi:ATP-binding cassette domain-containing protein [bacterium]|nr:MAG: ATP-binding cassette domain-containing protein [bacterium]
MIEFRNIYKKYGSNVIFDGFTEAIQTGEFVFLVGASGSGKSTLFKMLIKAETPDSGNILIDGYDLNDLRNPQLPMLRRQIAVIFQDFKLVPNKTVYENLEFAIRVQNIKINIPAKINELLDLVSLQHRKDALPKQLSGGEKQRVAIARAMSTDPKILLADEPTGNLDPQSTWQIVKLLDEINETGTTVIMATHDPEIVDTVNTRIIHLGSDNKAENKTKQYKEEVMNDFANEGRRFLYTEPDSKASTDIDNFESTYFANDFTSSDVQQPQDESFEGKMREAETRQEANSRFAQTENIRPENVKGSLLNETQENKHEDRASEFEKSFATKRSIFGSNLTERKPASPNTNQKQNYSSTLTSNNHVKKPKNDMSLNKDRKHNERKSDDKPKIDKNSIENKSYSIAENQNVPHKQFQNTSLARFKSIFSKNKVTSDTVDKKISIDIVEPTTQTKESHTSKHYQGFTYTTTKVSQISNDNVDELEVLDLPEDIKRTLRINRVRTIRQLKLMSEFELNKLVGSLNTWKVKKAIEKVRL